MIPLLTPENVAKLLAINVQTVYRHAKSLGGFYPAGIQCLRFREDYINDIMEGQPRMAVQFQVPTAEVQLEEVQNKKGSRHSIRRASKKGQGVIREAIKTREDRHNLFSSS